MWPGEREWMDGEERERERGEGGYLPNYGWCPWRKANLNPFPAIIASEAAIRVERHFYE